MLMRLIDRQGRVRERTLLLTALRDPAEPGDRLLVRFLGPNDIKGTAFLVWEHPDTEDERFLELARASAGCAASPAPRSRAELCRHRFLV